MSRWRAAGRGGWRSRDASGTIEHLDGVPFYDRPLPRRFHSCVASSRTADLDPVIERCACGAIRVGGGPWARRNSARVSAGRVQIVVVGARRR